MDEEGGVDFWKTVNGGVNGYLYRAQESLRTAGVNPQDIEKVQKHLGDEVFGGYQEAGEIARREMAKNSTSTQTQI